jgi:hypothetical protein
LKSLDSDERIQGNPTRFSGVFEPKPRGAKKTQMGLIGPAIAAYRPEGDPPPQLPR